LKWKIKIYENNCTGCRICQMICSWVNEGGFHPSRSLITIESKDEKGVQFSVRHNHICNNCGLCATYCTSKALVKERGNGDV